jgi:hypothetical protein
MCNCTSEFDAEPVIGQRESADPLAPPRNDGMEATMASTIPAVARNETNRISIDRKGFVPFARPRATASFSVPAGRGRR